MNTPLMSYGSKLFGLEHDLALIIGDGGRFFKATVTPAPADPAGVRGECTGR